jgi:hypothetical protein
MSITFTCRCGNVLRTADTNAGKPGKCPACSTPFIVPPKDGQALPAPQADVSDYPLRRATRQPVRESSRFDRLTADDVQLRPRLDEEDEEQKAERRRHRTASPLDFQDDDEEPPSRKRPIIIFSVGAAMLIAGGAWFRIDLDQGFIEVRALLLMLAGLVLTLVGGLGYLLTTSRPRK